jgi:hypothetical protein
MRKKPHQPPSGEERAWDRYRPKTKLCPICKTRDCKVGAKTCRDLECAAEYDRRYTRKYYEANSARIIANQSAAKRLQYKPIIKQCIAPHPTKPDAICGKDFQAGGRDLTCSPDCSRRRQNAAQRKRYRANPQAKRAYKNAYYAANLAYLPGTTRCPNPGCRRPYVKRRKNQHTCGRPSCHVWKYQTANRDKVNEKRRNKRRNNPAYAKYQRDYRAKNSEKYKSYRPKINSRLRQRRAAARQAAIAAGTFVDRRRKLTDSQKVKIVKRRRAGKTLKQIAKSFGIHFATVARICDTR